MTEQGMSQCDVLEVNRESFATNLTTDLENWIIRRFNTVGGTQDAVLHN